MVSLETVTCLPSIQHGTPCKEGISPSPVLELLELLDARCPRTEDGLGTVGDVQLIEDS